jgi:hypothetical protein
MRPEETKQAQGTTLVTISSLPTLRASRWCLSAAAVMGASDAHRPFLQRCLWPIFTSAPPVFTRVLIVPACPLLAAAKTGVPSTPRVFTAAGSPSAMASSAVFWCPFCAEGDGDGEGAGDESVVVGRRSVVGSRSFNFIEQLWYHPYA